MRKPFSKLNIFVGAMALPVLAYQLFKKKDAKPSQADTAHEKQQGQPPSEPPEPQIPEPNNGTKTSNHKTNQTQRPRWTDQQWQTVFTGLIFLVTAIYAVVSFFQWRTTEQALSLSKESLRVSQAASIRINDIQADFNNSRIQITLENIGHVVATAVKVRAQIERDAVGHAPEEWPIEWNSYSYFASSTQITPGGIKIVFSVPLQNFTQEDADLIRAGKQTLYVSCWFEYEDPLGTKIETSSLDFRYTPPPNEGWETMIEFNREDLKKRNQAEAERYKNQDKP